MTLHPKFALLANSTKAADKRLLSLDVDNMEGEWVSFNESQFLTVGKKKWTKLSTFENEGAVFTDSEGRKYVILEVVPEPKSYYPPYQNPLHHSFQFDMPNTQYYVDNPEYIIFVQVKGTNVMKWDDEFSSTHTHWIAKNTGVIFYPPENDTVHQIADNWWGKVTIKKMWVDKKVQFLNRTLR